MSLFDRAVAAALPLVPKGLVRRVARRYIAGETAEEAVAVALGLNGRGCRVTLDILGEHVVTLAQAERAAEEYRDLLGRIRSNRVDGNISLKLTQFGLRIDKPACRELTASVVRRAAETGNFVRIDMEDSSCTADTFAIYRSLRAEFPNVGAVMQAYLRRSAADLDALSELKPNLRLCKGVCVEPRRVA
jgi:proline dehydrogenase